LEEQLMELASVNQSVLGEKTELEKLISQLKLDILSYEKDLSNSRSLLASASDKAIESSDQVSRNGIAMNAVVSVSAALEMNVKELKSELHSAKCEVSFCGNFLNFG
jgi:hypothetical protein